MTIPFVLAGVVAVAATLLMVTRLEPVHALLYLIVSLLAVAVVFYVLGAPFVAALEVIVYAGAIMVLFIFVVMLLNLGGEAAASERRWLTPSAWVGPGVLAGVLLVEVAVLLARHPAAGGGGGGEVGPARVALALYGPYVLGVELASFLLMAALVGAYHVGRRRSRETEAR